MMPTPFRVLTSPLFDRDVKKLHAKHPALEGVIEHAKTILREDPHNRSRRYHIKKLTDVKPGQGQWRIRIGDYRLRYDIFGHDVMVHSFRYRPEAY